MLSKELKRELRKMKKFALPSLLSETVMEVVKFKFANIILKYFQYVKQRKCRQI